MSTLYIVSNADVIFVDTMEGTMAEEQRLARISELEALCAGQAFDHGKSIAEIMAEHIIVKEQKIAALTREVAGLRAAPKEGDERRRVKEMMGTKTHRRFIIAHETLLWVPKGRYVLTEYRTREEAEAVLAALAAVPTATPAPDGRDAV